MEKKIRTVRVWEDGGESTGEFIECIRLCEDKNAKSYQAEQGEL